MGLFFFLNDAKLCDPVPGLRLKNIFNWDNRFEFFRLEKEQKIFLQVLRVADQDNGLGVSNQQDQIGRRGI